MGNARHAFLRRVFTVPASFAALARDQVGNALSEFAVVRKRLRITRFPRGRRDTIAGG
jgi:hypothetical protein